MKLTKTWKLSAIDDIVKTKTEEEFKKTEEEFKEFGIRIIKKQNEIFQERLDALPKDFFNFSEYATFHYGEGYNEYRGIHLDEGFIFTNNNSYKSSQIILKGKDLKDFKILILKEKELLNFKEELRQELFKVIMACTTSKMLLKVFPEIEQYITFPNKEYPIMVKTDKLLVMLKND